MKVVAKLILVDDDDNHLMMWRSDHPEIGRDPDLPGGTAEEGESIVDAMLREVDEEIGIRFKDTDVVELYAGLDYSSHGTFKGLCLVRVSDRPAITMSWEHSRYEWLSKKEFLDIAKYAKDTYMHMVHDVLSKV